MSTLGTGHRRIEGASKVRGAERYAADVEIPKLAYTRLLLSPHAHARIRRLDLVRAQEAPGVISAIGGEGLTRLNLCTKLPLLAESEVLYAGQPVAVVVAETEAAAADAVELIEVDYEVLPPIVDVLEAIEPNAPAVLPSNWVAEPMDEDHSAGIIEEASEGRPNNCVLSVRHVRADASRALLKSVAVAGGRFVIPPVHQAPLETHVATARADPDGTYVIWTSTQGTFAIRDRTARMLGIQPRLITVVQVAVGGGFGGKLQPLLEPLVCVLARHCRRPVRLALTRTEEFLIAGSGQGAVIDLEIGADGEGNLTGLVARAIFDCGASRTSLGSEASLLLEGTYRLPAYDVSIFGVATHKVPITAYRAPGATQAYFALEIAIDELSEQLQIDPIDMRYRNASREGDLRHDGSRWPAIGLLQCLERARSLQLYKLPLRTGEGVGLAVGGVAGSVMPAAVSCWLDTDGTLVVQTGAVDLTGSNTALAIMAAEAFGLGVDSVRVESGSTAVSPWTGASAGSKAIYTLGAAAKNAAEEARRQVLAEAANLLEANPGDLDLVEGIVSVRGAPGRCVTVAQVAAAASSFGSRVARIQAEGRAAPPDPAPMFTVQIARVILDSETGSYQVTALAAIQDVGKAINPPEVRAQIHGGVAQGLGRALGEGTRYDQAGQPQTTNFLDYGIPTIDQIPLIETSLVEVPSPCGPWGARGVGEPPCVPGAAAVANALRHAGGPRIRRLPILSQELVADERAARSDAGSVKVG